MQKRSKPPSKPSSSLNFKAIVLFDEDVLVLNKPAGLLSQPDSGGGPVAVNEIKKVLGFDAPAFLAPVHRLDRNTSGLMIFATNPDSARVLTEALQKGHIKRTYHAIVKGDPGKNGRIDAPLSKDEEENRSQVSAEGKEAITCFRRLRKFPTCSLVEAWLETGRSHQIRAHFSHVGSPLLGDHKYASANWAKLMNRPALHAQSLKFIHPRTNEEITLTADYPADIEKLLATLLKISNQFS